MNWYKQAKIQTVDPSGHYYEHGHNVGDFMWIWHPGKGLEIQECNLSDNGNPSSHYEMVEYPESFFRGRAVSSGEDTKVTILPPSDISPLKERYMERIKARCPVCS